MNVTFGYNPTNVGSFSCDLLFINFTIITNISFLLTTSIHRHSPKCSMLMYFQILRIKVNVTAKRSCKDKSRALNIKHIKWLLRPKTTQTGQDFGGYWYILQSSTKATAWPRLNPDLHHEATRSTTMSPPPPPVGMLVHRRVILSIFSLLPINTSGQNKTVWS